MLSFNKRILFVGFGAVARCTLPVFLDHVKVDPRNITILDFDPTEVFSATTIVSNNINPGFRNATPLSSLATAGSTVTVLFSNNLSTTFALSQVNAGEIAVAGSGLAFGRASPGFGAGGDGIHVSASGNSSLNQSMIHNNTVNGYGGFGIHVETSGSAQAPNIVIENNITSFNGTGVNSAGTPSFARVARHVGITSPGRGARKEP